jgi:hypothetical protein
VPTGADKVHRVQDCSVAPYGDYRRIEKSKEGKNGFSLGRRPFGKHIG